MFDLFSIFTKWRERRRAHKREIDKFVLWQILCEDAEDESTARQAFFIHTLIDPAWRHLSTDERKAITQELVYARPH